VARTTRKERALQLLDRVKRGPAFSSMSVITTDEARRVYRLWAESWVIEDLYALIPELRRLPQEPEAA